MCIWNEHTVNVSFVVVISAVMVSCADDDSDTPAAAAARLLLSVCPLSSESVRSAASQKSFSRHIDSF